MIKNPIKFVKLFNSKSGTEQIVPLSTYERLSQESPKTMKNIQFICNCDEDGNKVEEAPKIENLKPLGDVINDKEINKKPVVTPLENGK